VRIRVTSDKEVLWRAGDAAYAEAHAGKEYDAEIRPDSKGRPWAYAAGACFPEIAYAAAQEQTYRFSFVGKRRGAIGAFSSFEASTEAASLKEAELKLYDSYDHVSIRSVVMPGGERVQYVP
jgi:hypothetical protein